MLVPLPYKILGFVLLLAATFAGGAYLGYQYCDGQQAQAVADATQQTLDRARQQAETDKQEAVDRAKREAMAAERARSAKSRGLSDASEKATTTCVRDAVSYRLLVDAIGAANGTALPARGVSEGLPGITHPKGRVRPGDQVLGVRND